MGSIRGFMTVARQPEGREAPAERVKHWREFAVRHTPAESAAQASRCMDCGTPFCSHSCTLHNIIPDMNDLVMKGRWREAYEVLASTSNFPEFTGRVCPALCEAGCVLNRVMDAPVTIRSLELAVIEKAWASGWVAPRPAAVKTGRKVAVVGSGPAGLACAQQLARAGHAVEVFEKADRAGGLLRYGIPDFKLEKTVIDRRLSQMEAEGVVFHLSCAVGGQKFPEGVMNLAKKTVTAQQLLKKFDAVVLAAGAEVPRNLEVPGRQLKGVSYALELLQPLNRRTAGDAVPELIDCAGADVVIIGGGDTGSDCVGAVNRQGAKSVVQIEHKPKPPAAEDQLLEWPAWPNKLRTSSSHEEGCTRLWSVGTKRLSADKAGAVKGVVVADLKWTRDAETDRWKCEEVPGSERELRADRVFLAMGFVSPSSGLLEAFGVKKTARGTADAGTADFRTSADRVWACGDCRFGQSLVVRAMAEGRACAAAVDRALMGESELPGV